MAKEYFYESATLKKVCDGDTVQLMVDVGFSAFVKEKFRFAGLDCPKKETPEGQSAMRFVESWFTRHGGECSVISHGKEKYGRWLATIASTKDKNDTLNGALLANSYAVPYEG